MNFAKNAIKDFVAYLNRRKQKLHLLKKLGKPCLINPNARFYFQKNIEIGAYVRIGHGCMFNGEGGLIIGEGTIFAPEVHVLTSSHTYKEVGMLPFSGEDEFKPVVIGKGCWLGYGAKVAPGVTIHDGAIVGMGALVVRDVAEGEIVGGNPATVLGKRTDSDKIQEMLSTKSYYIKHVLESNQFRRLKETPDFKRSVIK
jgi:maltose O-acetyltransferase